ncbi:unnamed protein product [Protopolystoma xenopodis]|uniref:Uncharacterized protein n=1 Tax=Protopolystoma xenopodis TaxID=117903 RepID=A0A448X8S3_9PLAT|nr:unnamed protein product [Protopolystoma xenopodis]
MDIVFQNRRLQTLAPFGEQVKSPLVLAKASSTDSPSRARNPQTPNPKRQTLLLASPTHVYLNRSNGTTDASASSVGSADKKVSRYSNREIGYNCQSPAETSQEAG